MKCVIKIINKNHGMKINVVCVLLLMLMFCRRRNETYFWAEIYCFKWVICMFWVAGFNISTTFNNKSNARRKSLFFFLVSYRLEHVVELFLYSVSFVLQFLGVLLLNWKISSLFSLILKIKTYLYDLWWFGGHLFLKMISFIQVQIFDSFVKAYKSNEWRAICCCFFFL